MSFGESLKDSPGIEESISRAQLHRMLIDNQAIGPVLFPMLEKLSMVELLWLMTKIDYRHIPDEWHYFNAQQGIEINFSLIHLNLESTTQLSALFCLAASNTEKSKIISGLIKKALLGKISASELEKYEDLLRQYEEKLSDTAIESTFPPAIEALTQSNLSQETRHGIDALLFRGERIDQVQHKALFLALHLLPFSKNLEQFNLDEGSLRLVHDSASDPNIWKYIQRSLTNQLGKQGELAHLILTVQTLYANSFEFKQSGEESVGAEDTDELEKKQASLESKLWFLMMLWSGFSQSDFYDREVISEQYNTVRILHRAESIQGIPLREFIQFIRQRPLLFQFIQSSILPDSLRENLMPFQNHLINTWCNTLTPESLIALLVQLRTDIDPAKMQILKLRQPIGLEKINYDQLLAVVALSPTHQKKVISTIGSVLQRRYPEVMREAARAEETCRIFLNNYLSILVKDLSFSNLRWLLMVCQDHSADFQKKIVKSMVVRPEAEIELGLPEADSTQTMTSQHQAILGEVIRSYESYLETEKQGTSESKDSQIAATRIALAEMQALSKKRDMSHAVIKDSLQRALLEKKGRHIKQANNLKNCLKIIFHNPELMSELADKVNKRLDVLYQLDLHSMHLMSLSKHYDLEQILPMVAMQDASIAPLVAIALARQLPITWRQWMLSMCKCLDFSNRPDLKIPGLPPDMLALASLRLKWLTVREQIYSLFYSTDDSIFTHPQFLPDESIYLPSEVVLFDQPDFVVEVKQKLTAPELWMLTEAIRSNPQLTMIDFGLMDLPKDIDYLVDVLTRHPCLKIVHGSKDPVRLMDKLIEKSYGRVTGKTNNTDFLIFSLLSNCHKQYGSEIIPKVLSGEIEPPPNMPESDRKLLMRLQRMMHADPLATLKVNWYCSMASCLAVKGELLKHGISEMELSSYSLEDMLEKELSLVMSDLHQHHSAPVAEPGVEARSDGNSAKTVGRHAPTYHAM